MAGDPRGGRPFRPGHFAWAALAAAQNGPSVFWTRAITDSGRNFSTRGEKLIGRIENLHWTWVRVGPRVGNPQRFGTGLQH